MPTDNVNALGAGALGAEPFGAGPIEPTIAKPDPPDPPEEEEKPDENEGGDGGDGGDDGGGDGGPDTNLPPIPTPEEDKPPGPPPDHPTAPPSPRLPKRDLSVNSSGIAPSLVPQNLEVGKRYDIAIDGVGLMLDKRPEADRTRYRRRQSELEVARFNSGVSNNLNETVDRYHFSGSREFHGGAGQRWANRQTSVADRYWNSHNIDPFTTLGAAKPLHQVEDVAGAGGFNPRFCVLGDTLVYQTKARGLARKATPAGAAVNYTDLNANIKDLKAGGGHWYAALGISIQRGTATETASEDWSDINAYEVDYSASRVFAAHTEVIDSVTWNVFTSINSEGEDEKPATEGVPSGHYRYDAETTIVLGHGIERGRYYYGLSDGTIWSWEISTGVNYVAPTSAMQLPDGTVPTQIMCAGGFVWIRAAVLRPGGKCRAQIIKAAVLDDGSLSPSVLVESELESDLVNERLHKEFAVSGNYVYFSWAANLDEPEFAGAHLAVADLVNGGWAPSYAANGNETYDVGIWNHKPVFVTNNDGTHTIVTVGDTYAKEAILETSIVDGASDLLKYFADAAVSLTPLTGSWTIKVDVSIRRGQFRSWVQRAQRSAETDVENYEALLINTGSVAAQSLQLRITLSSDGTETEAPELNSYQMRYWVAALHDDELLLQINCQDNLKDNYGSIIPYQKGKGSGTVLAHWLSETMNKFVTVDRIDTQFSRHLDTYERSVYEVRDVTHEAVVQRTGQAQEEIAQYVTLLMRRAVSQDGTTSYIEGTEGNRPVSGGGGSSVDTDRLLPRLPLTGDRNDKIAKFQGDTLRWEVDAGGGGGAPLSDADPLADGTAAPGSSSDASRADHVHPTDTTRAAGSALAAEVSARQAADTALGTRIDGVRQLPAFPAEGSRNDKIPKFDGDTLGWETDSGGGGGNVPPLSELPVAVYEMVDGVSATSSDRRIRTGALGYSGYVAAQNSVADGEIFTVIERRNAADDGNEFVDSDGNEVSGATGPVIKAGNYLVEIEGYYDGGSAGAGYRLAPNWSWTNGQGTRVELFSNAAYIRGSGPMLTILYGIMRLDADTTLKEASATNGLTLSQQTQEGPSPKVGQSPIKTESTALTFHKLAGIKGDKGDKGDTGGLAGLPAAAAANRDKWIKRSDTDETFEFVDAPSGSSGPQLPAFPAAGSRNDKVAKFDGDTLRWEPDAGGSSGPQLPAFPAEGSRNDKIPKFDGNTLRWELDATGGGGGGGGGGEAVIAKYALLDGLSATSSDRSTRTGSTTYYGYVMPNTAVADGEIFTVIQRRNAADDGNEFVDSDGNEVSGATGPVIKAGNYLVEIEARIEGNGLSDGPRVAPYLVAFNTDDAEAFRTAASYQGPQETSYQIVSALVELSADTTLNTNGFTVDQQQVGTSRSILTVTNPYMTWYKLPGGGGGGGSTVRWVFPTADADRKNNDSTKAGYYIFKANNRPLRTNTGTADGETIIFLYDSRGTRVGVATWWDTISQWVQTTTYIRSTIKEDSALTAIDLYNTIVDALDEGDDLQYGTLEHEKRHTYPHNILIAAPAGKGLLHAAVLPNRPSFTRPLQTGDILLLDADIGWNAQIGDSPELEIWDQNLVKHSANALNPDDPITVLKGRHHYAFYITSPLPAGTFDLRILFRRDGNAAEITGTLYSFAVFHDSSVGAVEAAIAAQDWILPSIAEVGAGYDEWLAEVTYPINKIVAYHNNLYRKTHGTDEEPIQPDPTDTDNWVKLTNVQTAAEVATTLGDAPGGGNDVESWIASLDRGGEIVPGVIERARGVEFPAERSADWAHNRFATYNLIEGMTFDEQPDHITVEMLGQGSGGGTAPVLRMILVGSRRQEASDYVILDLDEKARYYELEVTDDDDEYTLVIEEQSQGTDSGTFVFKVLDVLGFAGTSAAGRLVATIADKIINVGGEPVPGIDQAEMIGLINQLVPPAQRIPALAGHGGNIVQVAADEAALHLVDPETIADSTTASWAQPGEEWEDWLHGWEADRARRTVQLVHFGTGGTWATPTDALDTAWALFTGDTPSLDQAAALTYGLDAIDVQEYQTIVVRTLDIGPAHHGRLVWYRRSDTSTNYTRGLSQTFRVGERDGYIYYSHEYAGDPAGYRVHVEINDETDIWLAALQRAAVYKELKAIVKGAGAVKNDAAETITIA